MSQDFKDQILESFLRETLGNDSPPDLTARVLKALSENPAESGSASAASNGRRRIESILPPAVDSVLDGAIVGERAGHAGLAQMSANGRQANANGQSQAARPIPVRAVGRSRFQRRSLQTAVIGVSAAVLLLAAGFGFLLTRRVDGPPHRPTVAGGSTNGNGQPANGAAANGVIASGDRGRSDRGNGDRGNDTRQPHADSQLATNSVDSQVQRSTERRSPSREKLPNGDSFHETIVPFGGHPSDSAGSGGTPIVAKRRVDPLPDAKIVAAINGRLRATWTEHQATPTEPATDAEWCRRVYLRLTGRIPTVNELESFVASSSGAKRQVLIDHLVASHEFTEHWATILTNSLIGRTGGTEPNDLANRDGLRKYLEDALAGEKPYDEIAFELISAEGSNSASDPNYNAAVNYLLANYDPQATLATARTCQTFLGWQIRCVQCHHHPTEEGWGQDEFWSLNAFFRQMKVERDKQSGAVRLVDTDFRGEGSGDLAEAEIYYEDLSGYKRAAYPAFPGGPEIAKSGDIEQVDRRAELARMIASSDDLGRAFVNRVWSQFFGYGFTRPVDDMGPHNPPSHPEVLEQLAEQFAAHDYNIRELVGWVAASEPFSLSSRTRADQLADAPEAGGVPLFSRYYTRQLDPEEVYKSLLVASRSPGQSTSGAVQARQQWLGQFAQNMGTDEGTEIIAFHGDIRQSLEMMNSPLMRQATSTAEGSVLRRVAQSQMSPAEKVEHLFLASIAREPTKRELDLAVRMLSANGNEAAGLQDIWWALLNSSEFILDH